MSGSLNAKSERGTTTSNGFTNATTMPILSQDWLNAFANASGNLNGWGATPWQQQGADFFSG